MWLHEAELPAGIKQWKFSKVPIIQISETVHSKRLCVHAQQYTEVCYTFQPFTFTKKTMCCGSCTETYHSYEANITLLNPRQTKKN